MSEEIFELARQGYRHFNEVAEFDSAFISPDCEFDLSNAMPDVPPFKGLDRANAVLREWTEAFEDFHVEADRFLTTAEDRIVVFVRNTARLEGTADPIENHFVHVFTMRDGRAVRMEGYIDEDKALEAAGLRK